jgi:hypothetical protein
MRWLELGIAGGVGVLVVSFQLLPREWCEPLSVRAVATLAVGVATLAYIDLVDADRRGATAGHRILAGAIGGLAVAALNTAPVEGYWLALLLGGGLGYFGRYITGFSRS